jgi:hypothetical protein
MAWVVSLGMGMGVKNQILLNFPEIHYINNINISCILGDNSIRIWDKDDG